MAAVPRRKLLIVDDDAGLRRQLRWSMDQYEVVEADDRASAIVELRRNEPAVVLQDLGLPPDATGVEEGFATLREMLATLPATKVVVVTGNGDRDNAVRAVSLGAFDFCHKPLDAALLSLLVERAFRIHDLEEENRQLLRSSQAPVLEGIIARSDAMTRVCRVIEKIAPTSVTVLLLGESGTGKELLARALHRLSDRGDRPFVAINCAAIPENLLESELFGYERGAFTGASKTTPGKVEMAHKGTLFLDEIGDMPTSLQAKLLRFLEDRRVERLGSRESHPVDVRIVCATNQDLDAAVKGGRFREDLYFRIAGVTVRIPPLRERAGDAVILAQRLTRTCCERHGSPPLKLSPDAIAAIDAYAWPGNVRELENRINSAVLLAEERQISAADIGLAVTTAAPALPTLRDARRLAERDAIQRVLAAADGNLSRAAELLGISRPTLYDLLGRHELQPADDE
jgi:two-component system NtrC family response regulator